MTLPPVPALVLCLLFLLYAGISLDSIAKCAQRARIAAMSRKKATGGVVLIAAGRQKAAVVLECMMVHGGLVSHLVIDTDLEAEPRRRIGSEIRKHTLGRSVSSGLS